MMSYVSFRYLLLTFVLSTYLRTNYARRTNSERPEVTIPQGKLLGKILTTHHNRCISAFLGIPFAQPPTGNLRFASPVPADGWNGTRDASADSSICPQILEDTVLGDEDCLFINVYTPQLPRSSQPSSLLPVMVYIHGGAFKVESQLSTSAGPEYILDRDVVLVALNYRLGPLGFLSTGDEVASGNWGLKDQVLALKWVSDNVRYFGGDPDQVTIFGESAGAACIHLLTLSDSTIGLFHRYITQSGSALAIWAHRPRVAYSSNAFKLGEYVGCNNVTSDSLISCLRTVDFAHILGTDSQFLVWVSHPGAIWGPTDELESEDALLTDTPRNLFAAGKIRDLPWISGVVRNEGLIYTTELYEDEELFDYFLKNFDTLLPIMLNCMYQSDSGAAWTKAAKSYYFNNDLTSNRTELLSNFTMLIGDSHFWYPLRNALQQHYTLADNPQYFYILNYEGTLSHTWIYGRTTANYGIAHADELIYLFPKEQKLFGLNKTMSEKDYEMVDGIVQLWTSFATDGKPIVSTKNGTIVWEPYSSADGYLSIGNGTEVGFEVKHNFFPERMQFWTNIDAAVETTTRQEDSGTATSFSNFIFTLSVVTCSQFLLSALTAYRL